GAGAGTPAAPAAPTPGTKPAAPAPDPAAGEWAQKVGKLVTALKQASGAKLDELIAEYTTAQGAEYTEALGRSLPDLTRDGQEKARAALTVRMQRMKAGTLRDWLQNRKPEYAEVRAAAARACTSKNDLSLVPDLIDALADDEPAVRTAAHDSLRAL